MGLTATFINTATSTPDMAISQKNNAASVNSFSSFMDKLDRKDAAPKPVEKEKPASSPKRKENLRKEAVQEDNKNVNNNDEKQDTTSVETENSQKPVIAKSESVNTDKDVPQDELSAADTQFIQDLANILQVPMESLMEILAALNMVPADLTDANNLSLVMQKAFGIGSPLELLEIPNIGQVFREVQELVVNYTDNMTENSLNAISTETDNNNATVFQNTVAEPAKEIEHKTLNYEHEKQGQETAAYTSSLNTTTTTTNTASRNSNDNDLSGNSQQNPDSDIDQHFVTNLVNNFPVVKDSVRVDQLTVRAEAAKTINTQDVVNQIVERLKVDVRDNISEIRITLKPEHLGDVSLKVTTENGIVTAQFVAENQRIKEVIESNAAHLKNVLEEQGITLSMLSVTVGQDKGQERMDSFLRGRQNQSLRIKRLSGTQENDANESEEIVYADPADMMEYSIDYTA